MTLQGVIKDFNLSDDIYYILKKKKIVFAYAIICLLVWSYEMGERKYEFNQCEGYSQGLSGRSRAGCSP